MLPPWFRLVYVAVVLLGAVLAVGWVTTHIAGMWWRLLRDREPVRRAGPAGEFVHIPAMNVKRIRPNWLYRRHGVIFHRDMFRRRARFRIHPGGVEYGWSRRPVTAPFHAIEAVDAMPERHAFTLWFRGEREPVAVLTTSAVATRHALWLLAHHCPLTDRARAAAGDQPPAPAAVLGR